MKPTTILKDLKDKITEYSNPEKLGSEILDLLTKELYVQHPKQYSLLAQNFYVSSLRNDHILGATIICKWLECSEFKDRDALRHLANNMNTTWLSQAYCEPDLKYEVLIKWINIQPFPFASISDLFIELVDQLNTTDPELALSDIVIKFKLQDKQKLKLITTLIKPNDEYLTDRGLKINTNMNKILSKLDMRKLQEQELVKLLSLYPYLNKPILTKLSKLYPEGKFESIVSTAQALGVVENPDYWVQNLSSTHQIHDRCQQTTDLPEFH